jgi:hypothetical protein
MRHEYACQSAPKLPQAGQVIGTVGTVLTVASRNRTMSSWRGTMTLACGPASDRRSAPPHDGIANRGMWRDAAEMAVLAAAAIERCRCRLATRQMTRGRVIRPDFNSRMSTVA